MKKGIQNIYDPTCGRSDAFSASLVKMLSEMELFAVALKKLGIEATIEIRGNSAYVGVWETSELCLMYEPYVISHALIGANLTGDQFTVGYLKEMFSPVSYRKHSGGPDCFIDDCGELCEFPENDYFFVRKLANG